MSRVLILANNDIGLYKFRKELIEELLAEGNEVYISLPLGEFVQPLRDRGCKYINTTVDRRGIKPLKDLKLFLSYLNILIKLKPNLVVTYTIKPNIYGGIAARLKGIPYAVNITGLGTAFENKGLLKKFIIALYNLACKKAKVVFFENKESQQVFIEENIVKEEKTCRVKGAGVNLTEYKFSKYPPKGDIHCIFLGRVMKEKGIEELFEAAKRINKEYNNVIFDIVGSMEEDYKEEVKSLEDQGIIKFHGYQKDVTSFIEKSCCCILPSYHEGMSNTLLECAAIGRPLITSNIHGCKEAVIDGSSGYLVSAKDSEDLYEKIKKFIELPYEEKVIMGEASRNHVEKVFSRRKVVDITIKELKK